MAESEVIIIDSDDECEFSKDSKEKPQEKEVIECPICLQTCIHPARLPCGHIFCFLCVKGVAYKNRRCAMCRREIPPEFLDHPQLVYGVQDTQNTSEDGYQWFYEGRNGWWQYDERTCQDIEEAYKKGEKFCTILVAGYVYVVDFESMLQQRQNDPSRKRQVKRDLSSTPKKGVAGLRIDGSVDSHSHTATSSSISSAINPNNLINTIVATDAAIRIASDIIDSTLAHADEYRSAHSDSLNLTRNLNIGSNSTDDLAAVSDAIASAIIVTPPSVVPSSSTSGRDLLDEVEETLNISNASCVNSPPNLDDIFSLTINEFRALTLSNIVESSSDSENDDEDDAKQVVL